MSDADHASSGQEGRQPDPPPSRRSLAIGALAAAGAIATGGLLTSHEQRRRPPAGMVGTRGTSLMVDDAVWRPVGLNLPWSLGWGGVRTPTRAQHEQLFALLPSGSWLRMWAFGDWTPTQIASLVDLARPHGHRFTLVLADYLGKQSGERYVHASGSGSAFTDGGWRRTGWASDVLEPLADRFRDDPAIAMWELLNEPDPTDPNLLSFMRDAVDQLREHDQNHLVCSGTGTPTNLDAVRELNASDAVDVASVHEYDQQEFPSHWVTEAASLAREADKPLVVGEFGLSLGATGTAQSRATRLESKVSSMGDVPEVAGCAYWSGAAPRSYGRTDYEISVSDGPEVLALAKARLT